MKRLRWQKRGRNAGRNGDNKRKWKKIRMSQKVRKKKLRSPRRGEK